MKKKYLLSALGIFGTVTSLLAFADLYFFNSSLADWLQLPLALPIWSLMLIVFLLLGAYIVQEKTNQAPHKKKTVPSNSEAIQNFVVKNQLLNKATNIELVHYTAETLVFPWRHFLEEHPKPLKIRLLSRRPETDTKKQNTAEASLDTILEIVRQNKNIDIDVHFYNTDPLLRLQLYAGADTTCLLGFYRHDNQHPMRFVGAENNGMLILDNREKYEQEIINSLQSQFEYQWNNTSSIRSVIFDMDGVLVDSMPTHFTAWKKAFGEINANFKENDLKNEIYQREGQKDREIIEDLYRIYFGHNVDIDIINQIVTLKRKYYLEFSKDVLPIEGVYEILDYLKMRNVPLAVVTGTERDAATQIINQWFPKYFKTIVSASDVRRGKPDPEPYTLARKQLGISNPTHCIVIENAPLGIRSAKHANTLVLGILLNSSPLSSGHLLEAGANQVFENFSDIKKYFDSLTYIDIWKRRRDHSNE